MLYGMRLTCVGLVVAGLMVCGIAAHEACAQDVPPDPTLVLHYTFDKDPGKTAKDLSTYKNDGTIVDGQYLEEFNGRRGVLRFNGKSAYIDCGDPDSLNFTGDLTLELWLRMNEHRPKRWGFIFGERPDWNFSFGEVHALGVWYGHSAEHDEYEGNLVLPVDRTILSQEWTHIAVVVEYPRCRFYRNGELVYDALMPISGVTLMKGQSAYIGGIKDAQAPITYAPMDLDELRLYRRALAPEEITARAKGEDAGSVQAQELNVVPDWYEGEVTLRLTCRGADYSDYTAEMTLLRDDRTEAVTPKQVTFEEPFEGCGRYVAKAVFPLEPLKGQGYDAVARIGAPVQKTLHKHTFLGKPEWIDTKEGIWEGVPPPWTPVKAKRSRKRIELQVWGRRYEIGQTPLLRQIETGDVEILTQPITLRGKANGQDLIWDNLKTRLVEKSDTAAVVQQDGKTKFATLSIRNTTEYDGYMIFDCELQARRDLSLENLTLDIPLQTRHATLCFGQGVYPKDPSIALSSSHVQAVDGNLAFRFSPNIWLGDEERGLCWQAESDEDWHYADEQKAIEILPDGDTTTFRAHLVNVPTRLRKGETLHYKFALQATPVKPMLRDVWDLRLVRCHLWNEALTWPDREIEGLPALEWMRKNGIRHIYAHVIDLWPYPLPIHEEFGRKLHRLIDAVHDNDLRMFFYMIHQRYPTTTPEFDPYGAQIVTIPPGPYPLPVDPRTSYTVSQAGTNACPKSRAYRDSYVHSLAKRLDLYGDDGVYLDGTTDIVGCENTLHGCGYLAEDGSMRKTYPVFAIREFMKRLHGVVKQRRPDGVLDVHAGRVNASGLAYADSMWSGEQFHRTGTDHISEQLSLDRYRTAFMGYQIGVGADTLAYRLPGSRNNVLSFALLHDVFVRPLLPHGSEPEDYLKIILELWKLRDEFGAKEAEKFFYWNNQDYVTVSPEQCHSTLMKHPENGVLALVSNLRPDAKTVTVEFNLDKLGLRGKKLDVFNALTKKKITMTADGKLSVPIGSEEWVYIWLRPSLGR